MDGEMTIELELQNHRIDELEKNEAIIERKRFTLKVS